MVTPWVESLLHTLHIYRFFRDSAKLLHIPSLLQDHNAPWTNKPHSCSCILILAWSRSYSTRSSSRHSNRIYGPLAIWVWQRCKHSYQQASCCDPSTRPRCNMCISHRVSISIYWNNITSTEFRRENTVLRSWIRPEIVHVVPNTLIAEQFTPSPRQDTGDTSTLYTWARCHCIDNWRQ